MQVALAFTLLALGALVSQTSAAPYEATYNLNYGFNASRIVRSTVNYTDAAGTPLTVRIQYSRRWPSSTQTFLEYLRSPAAAAGLLCV